MMTQALGRELKVSELRRQSVVFLEKAGYPVISAWVVGIGEIYVHFYGGEQGLNFIAARRARDPEAIVDEDGLDWRMYEYLGIDYETFSPESGNARWIGPLGRQP